MIKFKQYLLTTQIKIKTARLIWSFIVGGYEYTTEVQANHKKFHKINYIQTKTNKCLPCLKNNAEEERTTK